MVTRADRYVLYGMQGSLYTAKVRSFLARGGFDFEERPVGDPRFREEIVPVVGRFIMPVVVTPAGQVIQDGADIVAALDPDTPNGTSAFPQAPVLRALALILEMFGGEGLLRPAMHYRWNFDADNLAFLEEDFCAALAPLADTEGRRAVFATASGRMRKAASTFGVTPESAPLIEAAYLQFLSLLEGHLGVAPFLLGGSPTVADHGLMGPLYAHLARDAHPASLMKRVAPRVYRWTERMNAAGRVHHEHVAAEPALFAPDALPDTLHALLRFIAEDWLPELEAHVAFANAWLAARPDLQAGTNGCARPGERVIGFAPFAWRGASISTAVMPYRFYLLQRVQDLFDAAEAADREALSGVLDRAGLSALLTLRTTRRVERVDHLEVWGP
jgi:glutathione S-transferase